MLFPWVFPCFHGHKPSQTGPFSWAPGPLGPSPALRQSRKLRKLRRCGRPEVSEKIYESFCRFLDVPSIASEKNDIYVQLIRKITMKLHNAESVSTESFCHTLEISADALTSVGDSSPVSPNCNRKPTETSMMMSTPDWYRLITPEFSTAGSPKKVIAGYRNWQPPFWMNMFTTNQSVAKPPPWTLGPRQTHRNHQPLRDEASISLTWAMQAMLGEWNASTWSNHACSYSVILQSDCKIFIKIHFTQQMFSIRTLELWPFELRNFTIPLGAQQDAMGDSRKNSSDPPVPWRAWCMKLATWRPRALGFPWVSKKRQITRHLYIPFDLQCQNVSDLMSPRVCAISWTNIRSCHW